MLGLMLRRAFGLLLRFALSSPRCALLRLAFISFQSSPAFSFLSFFARSATGRLTRGFRSFPSPLFLGRRES